MNQTHLIQTRTVCIILHIHQTIVYLIQAGTPPEWRLFNFEYEGVPMVHVHVDGKYHTNDSDRKPVIMKN